MPPTTSNGPLGVDQQDHTRLDQLGAAGAAYVGGWWSGPRTRLGCAVDGFGSSIISRGEA